MLELKPLDTESLANEIESITAGTGSTRITGKQSQVYIDDRNGRIVFDDGMGTGFLLTQCK